MIDSNDLKTPFLSAKDDRLLTKLSKVGIRSRFGVVFTVQSEWRNATFKSGSVFSFHFKRTPHVTALARESNEKKNIRRF